MMWRLSLGTGAGDSIYMEAESLEGKRRELKVVRLAWL